MEIQVKRKSTSAVDKYDILVNENITMYAVKKVMKLLSSIELFSLSSKSILNIDQVPAILKSKYRISYNENSKDYFFKSLSIWKQHWGCSKDENSFDIYGHKGLKYSVFQDDKQVAAFERQSIVSFKEDICNIEIDHDADLNLIIAFSLIISDLDKNDGNDANNVNVNLGNIGPEAREFDATWRPKE